MIQRPFFASMVKLGFKEFILEFHLRSFRVLFSLWQTTARERTEVMNNTLVFLSYDHCLQDLMDL